jgi:peptide/nickel transport system permease protein
VKPGLFIIICVALAAFLAPTLSTHSPTDYNLADKLAPPSAEHYLGTDSNGADIYSQILYGARLSLRISAAVVFISLFLGILLGSIAGYYGGWPDLFLMRFIDMLYAFPGFLLALTIIAFLGSSINNLILALCVTGWTAYARLVRGEIMNLKSRDFVTAAHAIGVSDWRIIARHLWPNLVAILSVQVSFGMAGAIVSEAGLSFLGLGAPANEPSWGALLSSGRKSLIQAPHVSLFPGLAIMTLVLGFNFLGDGLRKRFNPRD